MKHETRKIVQNFHTVTLTYGDIVEYLSAKMKIESPIEIRTMEDELLENKDTVLTVTWIDTKEE